MIPLYMSEVPHDIAERFLDCSKQIRFENQDDAATALHLEYVADTHAEMRLIVEDLKTISALLIGVKNNSAQALEEAVSLGEACAKNNRDHYIVYVLPSPGLLVDLSEHVQSITGVLLPPWDVKHILRVERKIVNDFRLLGLTDQDSLSPFVTLRYLGSLIRLNPQQIVYVEAQNKKLQIHQQGEDLAVYDSMETMRGRLGNRFFHCHRSYLVNCDAIYRIDLPNMEIELFDGTIIPISRSSRKQAQELCDQMYQNGTM